MQVIYKTSISLFIDFNRYQTPINLGSDQTPCPSHTATTTHSCVGSNICEDKT